MTGRQRLMIDRDDYHVYAILHILKYRKNPMDRPGACRRLVGLQATGDPNDTTENLRFSTFIDIPSMILRIVAENRPFGITLCFVESLHVECILMPDDKNAPVDRLPLATINKNLIGRMEGWQHGVAVDRNGGQI